MLSAAAATRLHIPEGPLPRARIRSASYDLYDPDPGAGDGLLGEMLEEQRRNVTAMKKVLVVLADDAIGDPAAFLALSASSAPVVRLVHEIAALPPEAGVGHFKLKGYLPVPVREENAMRFAALLLLFGARAMFLGERLGLGSLLSAVEARGFRYAPYLADDERQLVAGFHTFVLPLDDVFLADSYYAFVTGVIAKFPPGDRAFAALCVTRVLMMSCGRGASETA
ncbi:hypothetical protein [Massilia glaciei]|uniref:Uncharacterized protein n=1 Tax=Massilia glaciei TaxID=1524097 RepID=A0A2U2HNZ8_9BURK|nr:hypothetical protein [Massilia glaciei]PWF49199.1 hypothetical protein C7C56_007525 [Massilia glaciei]